MASLVDLQSKIDDYVGTYRKKGLPKIVRGKIFGLDKNATINGVIPEKYWPNKWPNSDEPGIYAIFSNEKLLYIGKASQQFIGFRLGSYFKNGKNGECVTMPNHTWSAPPAYVVTWAVPKEMFFEASALEEFLINAFKDDLPDNTRGTSV